MRWIDIGVNLVNKQFRRDRVAVLETARAAGVQRMVVTGTSRRTSEEARELALAHPGVLFSTAGVHPHHAGEYDDRIHEALAELLGDEAVVAVGECGLDYDRNFSAPADQRRAFARQLEQAAACGKPVFLHERAAHDDFAAILREHRSALSGAVVHCFTGGRAEAEAYLELGCHLGITGWVCDERRGDALREAVPAIPDDRLLLETDAPYLLPRDLPKGAAKGRRNEPRFLPHVAAAVAKLRGRPVKDLADHAWRATHALFGLPGA